MALPAEDIIQLFLYNSSKTDSNRYVDDIAFQIAVDDIAFNLFAYKVDRHYVTV